MQLICVDTGGTFADFVVIDGDTIRTFKLPSTPEDPSNVVLEGMALYDSHPVLRHGTTVATNAILEGKLAKTAFLTTAGFKDILHLRRQNREKLYDLEPKQPWVPVPRNHCYEIPCRLLPDGTELFPLDIRTIPNLKAYEAVAVCLLFGYANPNIEKTIASHLPQNLFVSISSVVSPEFREYERAATTTLNAAVGPIICDYLQRIREGVSAHFSVMSSNGGLIESSEAERLPIRTVLSGPAAGVVATENLCEKIGKRRAISFDMGGTSTDVCLIDGHATRSSLGEIAGIPIRQGRVDIHTVGCGGGSIAYTDQAGALQVGPQSAGANPGPALYGNGGPLTVTDANFILGRLPLQKFSVDTYPECAHQAVDSLAAKVGMVSPIELAHQIIVRADNSMAMAIRKVSSARGHDPADFSLVAFGGCGGLHACAIAKLLSMSEVIVPVGAGVFSALGLCASKHAWESWITVLTDNRDWCDIYTMLENEARAKVGNQAEVFWTAEFRYKGQSHEVSVEATRSREETVEKFRQEHHNRFGVTFPNNDIEWVTARVRAEADAHIPTPTLPIPPEETIGETVLYQDGDWINAKVLSGVAEKHEGPLLIATHDSTTFVPKGWTIQPTTSAFLLTAQS